MCLSSLQHFIPIHCRLVKLRIKTSTNTTFNIKSKIKYVDKCGLETYTKE